MNICKICGKQQAGMISHLSNHIKREHNLLYKDYYDQYIKQPNEGLCVVCGKPTTWWKKLYRTHCSNQCINNDPIVREKNRQNVLLAKQGVSVEQQELINQKRKQTLLKECGVENISQLDEIKKKKEATCLSNYGVRQYKMSKDGQKRYEDTMVNLYNTKTPLQNKEILQKLQNTMLNKYGVLSPCQNDEIKNKLKITKLYLGFNNIVDKYKNIVQPLFTKEEYSGTQQEDHLWKCCKCNTEFKAQYNILISKKCPICYPRTDEIKQQKIENFLKDILKLDIQINKRTLIPPYELDIFIPSKNVAIEFNGLYWHGELGGNKDKQYHLNKTKKCQEKNIKLVHIFEDELDKKENIVKSRLRNILGCNKYSIYARNCDIKEIDDTLKNKFLNKYHIQSTDTSSIKLGAFYKNRLVSVMTFKAPRPKFTNDIQPKNHYELVRFCSINNFNIVGIASKLLKYFEENYKPIKMVTYADLRWSIGKLYENLNFKLDHISDPNYWYIPYGKIERIHRFNFRKSQLSKKLSQFNENLTEWENMQNHLFDRIWDCGNMVFIKEYQSNNSV